MKYDMLKWHNKCDFCQDKGKYSKLDTSCQKFWIHITKILVNHIHQNTVSDEHSVTLQSNMLFLPTRMPIIVLQRVEKQIPAVSEIKLCACVQTKELSYFEDFYCPKNKMFSGNRMLPFFFYGLRF
jgi:hypothetical protein